jgi:hypothetical protein
LTRTLVCGWVIVVLLATATRFPASKSPMWEITGEVEGGTLKVAPEWTNWTARIPYSP